MLSIAKANHLQDYKINLVFSDGNKGIADLKETILTDHRPIFSTLKSLDLFRKFKIEHDTLVWSNKLDLAPEFLFFLAFRNNGQYQEKFKQWGYIS